MKMKLEGVVKKMLFPALLLLLSISTQAIAKEAKEKKENKDLKEKKVKEEKKYNDEITSSIVACALNMYLAGISEGECTARAPLEKDFYYVVKIKPQKFSQDLFKDAQKYLATLDKDLQKYYFKELLYPLVKKDRKARKEFCDYAMYAWKDGSEYAWKDGSEYAWKDGSEYAWRDGSEYAWKDGSEYAWKDGSEHAWKDGSEFAWGFLCNED